MRLYVITDWLGLVPIAVCMGFGVLGLTQLIRRRSLFKVDPDIIILGIYYIIVIAAYLIFEMLTVYVFAVLFAAFMVIGRLISGVHWATDIIGSILLSIGLFKLYYAAVLYTDMRKENGI